MVNLPSKAPKDYGRITDDHITTMRTTPDKKHLILGDRVFHKLQIGLNPQKISHHYGRLTHGFEKSSISIATTPDNQHFFASVGNCLRQFHLDSHT